MSSAGGPSSSDDGNASGHADAARPAQAVRARPPKRERTRARLLQAARVVFEREGFHGARLADIVAEADVSIGTFYNYYESKEEVFRDLVFTVHAELRPDQGVPGPGGDPVERIREGNRAYLQGYQSNARLWALLLQVSPQDPELFRVGQEIAAAFQQPIARAIARWQEEGRAWPDLDPADAARALAYMVDRYAYEWLGLGLPRDGEQAIDTLSKLWARGLGLERPTPPRRRASRTGESAVDRALRPRTPRGASRSSAAELRRLFEQLLVGAASPAGGAQTEEGHRRRVCELIEDLTHRGAYDGVDASAAVDAVLGMVEGLRLSVLAGMPAAAAADTVMSLLRLEVPRT